MIRNERQDRVLQILEQRRYATIQELAGELYVSTATIRRDVRQMEADGIVNCTYGGVSLTRSGRKNVPLPLRKMENVTVKQVIAKRAAALIKPHDSVFIDASSTAMNLVEHLSSDMDLTVFTYCMATASLLSQKKIDVYCMGGLYNHQSSVCTGHFAEQNFQTVTADIAFFSSQGLSVETGSIMDSSIEETRIRQVMMKQAKKNVFLCNASKIEARYPFILSSIEDMDVIVTDAVIPEKFNVEVLSV